MHQNKIVSILSLTQLTMITYFSARKIPTLPKSFWFFLIQISLYYAAFPLIILTDFPLNLVSCTQQMSADLTPKYLQFLLNHLWESPHIHYKLENLQTLFLTGVVQKQSPGSVLWKRCVLWKKTLCQSLFS